MPWLVEEVRELIAEYRQRPCLWDFFSKDYKVRERRADAWNQLAYVLNKDRAEVEKKIHALRVQYNEERRKILVKKLRGKPGDATPHSSWQYFDSLHFIMAGCRKRKNISSMTMGVPLSVKEEMMQPISLPPEEALEPPSSSTCHAQKMDNQLFKYHIPQKKGEVPIAPFSMVSQPVDEDYDAFGAYIVFEFRSLKSDAVRNRLKRTILSAIVKASEEDEALSLSSSQ